VRTVRNLNLRMTSIAAAIDANGMIIIVHFAGREKTLVIYIVKGYFAVDVYMASVLIGKESVKRVNPMMPGFVPALSAMDKNVNLSGSTGEDRTYQEHHIGNLTILVRTDVVLG
jgi:hypothetical protein